MECKVCIDFKIVVCCNSSNRDIVECKEIPHTVTSGSTLCSNRDIVECKAECRDCL